MWLGKELGRSIMDTTKSNIEERFPLASDVEGDNDIVIDMVSGRSSFGFEEGDFGANRFQTEWANPGSEELTAGETEPVVTFTLLGPDEGIPGTEGEEGEVVDGSEVQDPDSGSEGSSNIFELGDSTTYRIQVGTFAERKNAEGVWSDLTHAGYSVSISTFQGDNDVTMYRVTVGTYHKLEEANSVAEAIRSMGFTGTWVQEIVNE